MSPEETTRVSKLTGMNQQALSEHREAAGIVELGATYAVFAGTPEEASARLDALIEQLGATHGRRGHPVASLHAVARKLRAAS